MTQVFIEIISLNLEEGGASMELINSLIDEGLLIRFLVVVAVLVLVLFVCLDVLLLLIYHVMLYTVACRHNPYILWVMTYSHLLGELDELIDELMTTQASSSSSASASAGESAANRIEFKADSLEEALIYYRLDGGLWLEVDNSVDILANYIHEKKLAPSPITVVGDGPSNSNTSSNSDAEQGQDGDNSGIPGDLDLGSTVEMCHSCYNMAVSIIQKELL